MTVSHSYNYSLTIPFSQGVEYKLFPWFDESFSANVRLNFPLTGISQPMQRLFPGYMLAEDESSARVFSATLDFTGPDNGVPKDVCLKLARGVDEVVRLSHEASIYQRVLAKLWGIAVPSMYGFFIGHEDTPVACLLLELCLAPTLQLRNSEEFVYVPFFLSCHWSLINLCSRLAMQNVRKVHTLGITQNMPLELHHFVMKDNKVMLVDFSRAVVHRCKSAMPVYSNQRFCIDRRDVIDDDGHDCDGLMTMARKRMQAVAVA